MNSSKNKIIIKNARVHNLKNISLEIPKNKLVVMTGVSGSGKSSLAFDTIYAEGQRRYVESLSNYARQFVGVLDKPDVDQIEGLSPAISIDQRSGSSNPRSTVGTLTEIYDYLRLLFARIGIPHCPECGQEIFKQTKQQILEKILNFENEQIKILAPVVKNKKGDIKKIIQEISDAGYQEVRLDGKFYLIDEVLSLEIDGQENHTLEIVVGTEDVETRRGVSLQTALDLGDGLVTIYETDTQKEHAFSQNFSCSKCEIDLPEIEPRLFSFNSPFGACPDCSGLGVKQEIDPELIIPNKNLSVAQGAIRPWIKTGVSVNNLIMKQLNELAQKFNFSIHTPIKDLTKKQLSIIFYGSQNESVGAFEGVINNLMKKYKETESTYIRTEIEKYIRSFPCPICRGARLNPIALSVTVAGKNISEVCQMTIEECEEFFKELRK